MKEEEVKDILYAVDNKIATQIAIGFLKERLEINIGMLAEPLLKEGKNPIKDEKCHKALVILAHLKEIEEYCNPKTPSSPQ